MIIVPVLCTRPLVLVKRVLRSQWVAALGEDSVAWDELCLEVVNLSLWHWAKGDSLVDEGSGAALKGVRLAVVDGDSARRGVGAGARFKLGVLRERCRDCVGGELGRVRKCSNTECPLHDYRMGHRPKGRQAKYTPLKALRAFCLWCCCGSYKEVRLCPAMDCPLWPWRLGRATGEVPPPAVPSDVPAEPEIPGQEGE